MKNDPHDPVQAVTAVDPYPYYARLRTERPWYFDERLSSWVAASADLVERALQHPDLLVRPPGQPVPPALQGTAAGAVFGRLARMSEGVPHAAARRALKTVLAAWQPAEARRLAAEQASAAWAARSADDAEALYRVPLLVMAQLLGVPDGECPRVVRRVEAFVACLSPLSGAAQLEAAQAAAAELSDCFERGLGDWAPPQEPGLAREVFAANLVGLLSQTCDATAGLIGNTALALGRDAALCAGVRAGRQPLDGVVAEVARHDPSIQNTRRYAGRAVRLGAGVEVAAGEAVLLLLAAANRDPALHAQPERFDAHRRQVGHDGFGSGRHRCPGSDLAAAMACGAVAALVQQPDRLCSAAASFGKRPVYRPSVNARIPLLTL